MTGVQTCVFRSGLGRPRKHPPLPLTPPQVKDPSGPIQHHYESPTNVSVIASKKKKISTTLDENDYSSKSVRKPTPSVRRDKKANPSEIKQSISSTEISRPLTLENGVERHLSRIADVMERMSNVMIEFYQAQINSMKSGNFPVTTTLSNPSTKDKEPLEDPALIELSTHKESETIMPSVTCEQQENSDPSNNVISVEDFNLPNKPFGGYVEEPLSKDNLGAYFRSRAVLTKSRLFK